MSSLIESASKFLISIFSFHIKMTHPLVSDNINLFHDSVEVFRVPQVFTTTISTSRTEEKCYWDII